MKKVNFEPNERVDAPDANAIGDVASEHVDRLGVSLVEQSNRHLDDEQRIAQPNIGSGANAPLVFGHFTVRTFSAETQPFSLLITEVPRLFFESEATGDLGALGGVNVESPLLDLSDFSNLNAGMSFFIYGRIKEVAGVKENRARWRADLNPPREEVYLANTRRLPYFDARASSSLLPSSEGWFKIAKVTRTDFTGSSLRCFELLTSTPALSQAQSVLGLLLAKIQETHSSHIAPCLSSVKVLLRRSLGMRLRLHRL